MKPRTRSIVAIALVTTVLTLVVSLHVRAATPRAQRADETMKVLLAEVHALRLAMEHTAAIAPRVQLTLARLGIEEQRTMQIGTQLDQVRRQLADTVLESKKLAGSRKSHSGAHQRGATKGLGIRASRHQTKIVSAGSPGATAAHQGKRIRAGARDRAGTLGRFERPPGRTGTTSRPDPVGCALRIDAEERASS